MCATEQFDVTGDLGQVVPHPEQRKSAEVNDGSGGLGIGRQHRGVDRGQVPQVPLGRSQPHEVPVHDDESGRGLQHIPRVRLAVSDNKSFRPGSGVVGQLAVGRHQCGHSRCVPGQQGAGLLTVPAGAPGLAGAVDRGS